MREMTPPAEAQRTSPFSKLRLVAHIDPDRDGSWALKYSDSALTIGADTYEAYVQSWSAHQTKLDHHADADEVAKLTGLGRIDDLQIKFKNSDFPAEKFHTIYTQYDLEGAPIRFGIWFVGTGSADIVWLFRGIIDAILETSIKGTDVDAIELGATRSREIPENEINLDDFPDAPDSSIGEKIRRIYGETRKVPASAVTSGKTTELYGSHGPADTTIRVYSVVGFPASGTIRIDAEEITYTGVDESYDHLGTTVQAFTGCSRGVGAVFHQHGTEVSEQAEETIFVITDHPCEDVSMVRVEGQLADPEDFTVNKNDTSLVSGRALATITFNGRPKYWRRSASSEEMILTPDAEGDGNENEDFEKTYDEVEANSYARLGEAEGPLVVKRVSSPPVGESSEAPVIVAISDDTHVESYYPDTNYGSFSHLVIFYYAAWKASRGYLRLDPSAIPAEYGSCKLWFYLWYGDGYEYKVTPAASSFDPATLTWNNQPNGTGWAPTGSVIATGTTTAGWNSVVLPATLDWTKGIVIWTEDGTGQTINFYTSE